MHACGDPAKPRASSRAAARACPGSTNRFANPIRRASSPPTPRPVRIKIQRVTVTDQARQANGTQIDQRDTEAPAIDAENGVARGDAQVAPAGQLQTSG